MSYRHDKALAAVKAAEERYAIEEWKKGKLICPWCGQPLDPKPLISQQVMFAEMARRMVEDPQAWLALVCECGQPGMTLEELARALRCSVATASRARERARTLMRGMGREPPPRLAAQANHGQDAGGVEVLSKGGGKVG